MVTRSIALTRLPHIGYDLVGTRFIASARLPHLWGKGAAPDIPIKWFNIIIASEIDRKNLKEK